MDPGGDPRSFHERSKRKLGEEKRESMEGSRKTKRAPFPFRRKKGSKKIKPGGRIIGNRNAGKRYGTIFGSAKQKRRSNSVLHEDSSGAPKDAATTPPPQEGSKGSDRQPRENPGGYHHRERQQTLSPRGAREKTTQEEEIGAVSAEASVEKSGGAEISMKQPLGVSLHHRSEEI